MRNWTCVFLVLPLFEMCVQETNEPLQAKAPRFMYVPNDIIKRREAIGVGVCRKPPQHLSSTKQCFFQDIRDFALHLIADAPPVGWVRVEVSSCNRECMMEL